MRRVLGIVGALLAGACSSQPAHLALPAGPACDVPAAPRVLYAGFDCGPGWLAVDDARLYWREMSLVDGHESLVVADKCGAGSQRLGAAPLQAMAPADGMLYGTDGSHLFAIPADGRASVAVVSGFRNLVDLAVDPADDTAVVAAPLPCARADGCAVPGALWRVHRTGGTPEALVPVMADVGIDQVVIAPDGYYIRGTLGTDVRQIYHLGRDGQVLEQLGDRGAVYLASDPQSGALFALTSRGIEARAGSGFRTVWPLAPGDVRAFAIDDRDVYVVHADGHLGRRPQHGEGAEEVLLRGDVVAVGLDAGSVYAFDCHLSSGRILQLAR